MLENVKAIVELERRLNGFKIVSRFDSPEEPECTRLAHSMADLEGSFRTFLDTQLPALMEATTEEEVSNALLDIGEELRHVLYHIRDPKFFEYLEPGSN